MAEPNDEPIVIVDRNGDEHEFPAGTDPKRAGAIVRLQVAEETAPQTRDTRAPGGYGVAGYGAPAGTLNVEGRKPASTEQFRDKSVAEGWPDFLKREAKSFAGTAAGMGMGLIEGFADPGRVARDAALRGEPFAPAVGVLSMPGRIFSATHSQAPDGSFQLGTDNPEQAGSAAAEAASLLPIGGRVLRNPAQAIRNVPADVATVARGARAVANHPATVPGLLSVAGAAEGYGSGGVLGALRGAATGGGLGAAYEAIKTIRGLKSATEAATEAAAKRAAKRAAPAAPKPKTDPFVTKMAQGAKIDPDKLRIAGGMSRAGQLAASPNRGGALQRPGAPIAGADDAAIAALVEEKLASSLDAVPGRTAGLPDTVTLQPSHATPTGQPPVTRGGQTPETLARGMAQGTLAPQAAHQAALRTVTPGEATTPPAGAPGATQPSKSPPVQQGGPTSPTTPAAVQSAIATEARGRMGGVGPLTGDEAVRASAARRASEDYASGKRNPAEVLDINFIGGNKKGRLLPGMQWQEVATGFRELFRKSRKEGLTPEEAARMNTYDKRLSQDEKIFLMSQP